MQNSNCDDTSSAINTKNFQTSDCQRTHGTPSFAAKAAAAAAAEEDHDFHAAATAATTQEGDNFNNQQAFRAVNKITSHTMHRYQKESSVVDIVNTMLVQRQLLLQRQARELNDFLCHPTDRYTGPKEDSTVRHVLVQDEGPLKLMNDLTLKIELLRKDLKKKERIIKSGLKN